MDTSIKNYIDPICGMDVQSDSKFHAKVDDQEFFFCSAKCQDTFLKNPSQYIKNRQQAADSDMESPLKTYYPLILIFAYLIGATFLIEFKLGAFDSTRMMAHFMGLFFIVFSFFKLLDLKGFANSYRSYDWITKKVPAYGFVYPFIELILGLSYLSFGSNLALNSIVIIIMAVSSFGVVQSILNKKSIACACLGTVFKFPVSTVTLFEDFLMLGMALMGVLANLG